MNSDKGNNLRAKRWMLVSNNPTSRECIDLAELGTRLDLITTLVYGLENADQHDKTEHIHVYVSFKQTWRFNRLKKMFPRMRIEVAKKPALACIRYVTKQGFYFAYGNMPNQNQQSEQKKAQEEAREQVVHKIRTGELRMKDLSDEQLLDKKLISAVKEARNMTLGPKRTDLRVCVFITPTGWGKSYAVNQTFDDICEVDIAQQEWFLNAEADVMLFDEFCGQIRCTKMLRYLDEYKVSLPVKGGHSPCYFKAIFICSNTSPNEWYMTTDPKTGETKSTIPDEVRKALYRRIGYPLPSLRRETHIYDPLFTSLDAARKDMMQICQKIKSEIYKDEQPEQISDEDSEQEQEQEPANKRQRNSQQDEQHEQDSCIPSEQDPNLDVPEIQILQEPQDSPPYHSPIIIEHESLPDKNNDSDFEDILQNGL